MMNTETQRRYWATQRRKGARGNNTETQKHREDFIGSATPDRVSNFVRWVTLGVAQSHTEDCKTHSFNFCPPYIGQTEVLW